MINLGDEILGLSPESTAELMRIISGCGRSPEEIAEALNLVATRTREPASTPARTTPRLIPSWRNATPYGGSVSVRVTS